MIAAGFGCRAGCAREDILSALSAALAHAGRALDDIEALYVPDFKQQEDVLSQVANQLGKPLVLLAREALSAQAAFAVTISPHAIARAGVPSVAETAALAGASARSAAPARLLGPRRTFGGATCALAAAEGVR